MSSTSAPMDSSRCSASVPCCSFRASTLSSVSSARSADWLS
uniref:Secreted protein n=1 Tax=Macrostomum lignano TaxID=282301 RepID=A0A1I8G8V2_9PLAT